MPFTLVIQDITKMKVDAIVNAANTELLMGGGVCGAVFRAAGEREMREACRAKAPIQTGGAAITPGFNLPAKFVIHAAGPVYNHKDKEHCERLLYSAYTESLKLASENRCASVALPLISSGIYGYPKDEALKIATAAIADFLAENDMDVYLAVLDKDSIAVSERLMSDVSGYIDEHYIDIHKYIARRFLEVGDASVDDSIAPEPDESKPDALSRQSRKKASRRRLDSKKTQSACEQKPTPKESPVDEFDRLCACLDVKDAIFEESSASQADEFSSEELKKASHRCSYSVRPSCASAASPALEEWLNIPPFGDLDESFSDYLLKLIDKKGKTDVEVYRKANIERQLFSKIRTGKGYTPKKPTVLALAVGLELTLEETNDLLKRAGYALSPASKLDVIVEYFIIKRKYAICEINEVLFKYDQPLLGSQPRDLRDKRGSL